MWSPGALPRWCMNPVLLNYTLRKRNATIQLSEGVIFCHFTCSQTSEYGERSLDSFGMGFLHIVTESIAEIKYPTKII